MTREEAIDILKWDVNYGDGKIKDTINMAIKALDFTEWVAEEIFSDDWEFNKDSFEELACRKLEKMGIVRKTDTDWELADKE